MPVAALHRRHQLVKGEVDRIRSHDPTFRSPGMTSATGYLPPSSHNIPKGTPVAVHAYGKENALAIGLLTMSTDEIRSVNKNIGVENIAFLGDDLWKVDRL